MRTRVVGCFVWHEGRFLLLERNPEKAWGLVAGTVESDESDEDAMLRELYEETGHHAKAEDLRRLGVWEFELPDRTLEFPTFELKLDKGIKVKLDPDEHYSHEWVTPRECYDHENLISGLQDLLLLAGIIKDATRKSWP